MRAGNLIKTAISLLKMIQVVRLISEWSGMSLPYSISILQSTVFQLPDSISTLFQLETISMNLTFRLAEFNYPT